jgi:hypothetical protein
MAKIRTGSLAGNIRGSVGADTFSQNRYGTYIRKRAIPTVVNTPYTQKIRSAFAACSMMWQALTQEQRNMWSTWADNNPVRDNFGELQKLSGNVAFIKLNTKLLYNDFDVILDPPQKSAPVAIEGIAISEMSATEFKINTEPNILAENERLILDGYLSDVPSLNFYKNKLRQIACLKKEEATPIDIKPYVDNKFGTMVKGQTLYLRAYVLNKESGQISIPYYTGFFYNYN